MPAIDTEAQFKFLLCCIKHSAAGKVNFDNVAAELEIVSKAAAAKRYERLLKAHDISPATPRKGAAATKKDEDGGDEAADPETPVSKKRKRGGAKAAAVKKDPETETPVKKERAVKKENKVKQEESSEETEVKGESDDDDYTSE